MSNYLIGPRLLADIKDVVRTVKGDGAAEGTVRVSTRFDSTQKTFRICTFTGSWSINDTKAVTFRGVTTTPNTVNATNLFASIAAASSSRNCAIAKDGTAWYLIAAQC